MTISISSFQKGKIIPYVQPIVVSDTSDVLFWEVLSRISINGNIYPPSYFIKDLTDEQKFELAKFLFEQVAIFQATYPNQKFSVNLSSLEIHLGISDYLIKLANINSFPRLIPNRCIIEITESSIIDEHTFSTITFLKNSLGFLFALDDFGAERSTFKQLKNSEELFDYIKIDGSLIEDIDVNEKHFLMLFHIIQIIKVLGKKSIVEFVSNESLMNKALLAQTDFMQGYYFCEPTPIAFLNNYSLATLPSSEHIETEEEILSYIRNVL